MNQLQNTNKGKIVVLSLDEPRYALYLFLSLEEDKILEKAI